MIAQESWAATAPEENVPAIDIVLNHRPVDEEKGGATTIDSDGSCIDGRTGKDAADLGRDDFEYYVSSNRVHSQL